MTMSVPEDYISGLGAPPLRDGVSAKPLTDPLGEQHPALPGVWDFGGSFLLMEERGDLSGFRAV